MKLTETIPTNPIVVQKSLRVDEKRVLTSGNAGKVLPLAVVPLLREDRVSSGRMRFSFEMMETAEMLMNAINVTVRAHFVPFLAFDRFNGMDQFNRSYKGIPETEGGSPIPFFETMAFDRNAEFWSTLGMHAKQGEMVNNAPVEAYNQIVNFMRKARSAKLTQRNRLDTSLAACFWHNTKMSHIVPDFDQAKIDGEVALNIVSSTMPVRSKYRMSGIQDVRDVNNIIRSGDAELPAQKQGVYRVENGAYVWDEIWTEMQANGITVSLSNIELAKKTAAFAELRSRFDGIDDDHIIDLLMEGVRVPEEMMSQPILLDRKTTMFGYSRRYATDAGNLAESVTSGQTFVDISLRTPPMNTGGVIMITAEIVPEQLFERQKDYFLYANNTDQLPNFTRDFLDPEKVAVVKNEHVDIDHDTPDATFGYAPLNHEWQRKLVNVGGKYYRPEVDAAFDEDRQKIWANETPNPTLTEDFYLATNLHNKVFADTLADGFEIIGIGKFDIVGNTVFGKGLTEATDDYDTLMGQVDMTRIEQA
jgi:hypothetical protein